MSKNIQIIPIKLIVPDPNQPRQEFDPGEMSRLEKSITRQGVLVPLALEEMKDDRYLLVDGERRYRSAVKLGLKEVPAIVYKPMDEQERMMTRFHLQEQHANWTTYDKAKAIALLKEATDLSVAEIADLLGMAKTTIADYLALLSLSKRTIQVANTHKLSFNYLAPIASTLRRVESVQQRRDLEAALIDKAKNKVVTKGQDISGYSIAIREGGESIVKKIIEEPDYTPKDALTDAGVLGKIEHRKIMGWVSHLANMLAKASDRKLNRNMNGNDEKTFDRLAEAIERYRD